MLYFRTWEEEIYFNTQEICKTKQQSIYFDESERRFDGIEEECMGSEVTMNVCNQYLLPK